MTKRQVGVLTLLALAAFVLAMLTTRRLWFRADLTEGKAYTLQAVSKELYKEIPEQVVITYYLSEKLAKVHPVPAEIEDLLREYAAYSRGRIRVVIQDPVKAGTVAAAERLGVEPQQIQTMEQDESSVATVYTGIVVEYLDRTETIPTAFSLDTLEYDLTARIRAVVRGTTRSVGVIVAAADKTWQADFPFLEKALSSAGYQVREIAAGSQIPEGLSALFVFGGATELDDWSIYRIDSYVRSGGHVLFATEGVFVDSHADLRATPVGPSPLLDLLATYGVKVERQLALDQAALTLPIQTQSPEGGSQVRLVRYPHWIALLERYADKTHPVTAHFSGLDLYWASPLTVKAPAGVAAQVLASTTEDGWRMTKDFQTNPADSDLFFAEAGTTRGHIPLVVALSGSFPSPFLGHPKPTRAGSKEILSDLPSVAKATRILVVGDGDFATTLIQYSRSERNLEFLVSAADWLGSDDDLAAIRSRAYRDGRLDSISDPAERSRAMIGAQLVNVVVIPLAVVIFGLVRAIKRRKGEDRGISS